jgi:hypothetical protein
MDIPFLSILYLRVLTLLPFPSLSPSAPPSLQCSLRFTERDHLYSFTSVSGSFPFPSLSTYPVLFCTTIYYHTPLPSIIQLQRAHTAEDLDGPLVALGPLSFPLTFFGQHRFPTLTST